MKRILVVISLGWLLFVGGCGVTKLDGMTPGQAFDNPQVAALVEAAVQGDINEIDRLVAKGTEVNSVAANGLTPLIWVLSTHRMDGAKRLIELGANPNYIASNGFSAMSLAAGGNRPAVLRLLLEHGGDPDLMGHDGHPLLHIAVLNMRWANMRMLLEFGGNINIVRPSDHDTAANIAAGLGQFDQVVFMLDHGFNADLQRLAKYVDMVRVPPGSEAEKWKQVAISRLMAKGITFPAFVPNRNVIR